tara:strand:+ start:538 stop:702 length:165 start_codon:yes stop_codon:yes gene_type:complete
MLTWLKNRMGEVTSWNGTAMIAVALVVLFATPFAKWAAYAAILYGVYSIWKSED